MRSRELCTVLYLPACHSLHCVSHTLPSLFIIGSQLMSQNFDRNPRMAWLSERH